MKLLVDMNLSPRWVDLLNKAGFDAAHWSALGPRDASDLQIMTFASAHDYVVLTHDLDFSAILAATHGTKPSVVQIRSEDVGPEAIGQAAVGVLYNMAADLDRGALVSVDPYRARLRILPLVSDSS
jgi:predicted nuclease of predicted toxin-antitoxin system